MMASCVVCGEPGLIHWTPFYINSEDRLAPTDGGSYGQTVFCDTHYTSFFDNAGEWLAKARAEA